MLMEYVTRPAKAGHICATTEIYFLSVHESYTHALPINTKYVLGHRWPGLFSQMGFCRCSLTTRIYLLALRGINRTEWGTKLFLMVVLAHPLGCIRLCHIMKAQHCCLSPNGSLSPPSAPHTPPPPSCPPTPYRLNL